MSLPTNGSWQDSSDTSGWYLYFIMLISVLNGLELGIKIWKLMKQKQIKGNMDIPGDGVVVGLGVVPVQWW